MPSGGGAGGRRPGPEASGGGDQAGPAAGHAAAWYFVLISILAYICIFCGTSVYFDISIYFVLFIFFYLSPQTSTCSGINLQDGKLECGNAHPQPNRDLQASNAENTHTEHKKIPANYWL